MKILVTCPPMLGMIESFRYLFAERGIELSAPNVVQTMSVDELKEIVPQHDGWIIGDDPATREVFEAGKAGNLKAAVKWGIGVDNVDFDACKDLDIPIINTPDMFGREVADVAMGYVIALARETFEIDRAVRKGEWIKPRGISLSGKTVALVGFGDIGKNTAKRLLAADMKVIAYDPFLQFESNVWVNVEKLDLDSVLKRSDIVSMHIPLNEQTKHLISGARLKLMQSSGILINAARGGVVDENALVEALLKGELAGAAIDVFESEPLSDTNASKFKNIDNLLITPHIAGLTSESNTRVSFLTAQTVAEFIAK